MKQFTFIFIALFLCQNLVAQEDSTKVKVLNKNIVTVVDGVHSTNVKIGNKKGIEVVTDDFGDTTKIRIGKHVFNVVEDYDGSHVEFSKVDTERTPWRRKMNGHWAGVELGVNMFRDADYSMYGNPGFGEFLDLHQAKSLSVNINFLEFVFSNERNNFGLVTGMGLSSMNFRFDEPITLIKENGIIFPEDISHLNNLKKTKLNVAYLTVPLMLQVKTPLRLNASHVNLLAGVIGSFNIGSHTKVKHDHDKFKERGNFNLNEFKYELTGRLAFGDFYFFANYSMTPLFKDHKGPELYPFTVGISFANF